MDLSPFLREHRYVDFSASIIQECLRTLFKNTNGDLDKAKKAYHFVRDEIPHSFDCGASVITAKASDVLAHRTGICHARANLLAALLRPQGIPVGFCFQHTTLLDDDSKGYCVHCFNAIRIQDKWLKVDARGNTYGKNAQFSTNEPILAFPNRPEYDEYFWHGVYPEPQPSTMKMLEEATSLQDVLNNIPDNIADLSAIYRQTASENEESQLPS